MNLFSPMSVFSQAFCNIPVHLSHVSRVLHQKGK